MKKIIASLLFSAAFLSGTAQIQRKLSAYVSALYSETLYDRTIGNNQRGIGAGLQMFYNNKTNFKPAIELTATFSLEDDKVYRVNADGTEMPSASAMVNLFAGMAFSPVKNVEVSFVAGPSFINSQTLLGIKPSLSLYFGKNKKWITKASFINIYNRDKATREDFGTVSFAIAHKLF